jgi:hypothetical protein
MVTVIDMTTGELVYQSPSRICEAGASQREETLSLPSLALQEISLEPERASHALPPDLALCSPGEFLTKFD